MRRAQAMTLLLGLAVNFTKANDIAPKGLTFVLITKEEGRNLGGGSRLGKNYGYFAEDGGEYCIELPKGDATELRKLWLNKCNPGKRKQLWRFDGNLIRSRVDDGMCMEVRKEDQEGATLRINGCKKNKSNQKWTFDGDNLSPKNDDDLCAYPRNDNFQPKVPIVLTDCAHVDSFDFNEE